MNTIFEILVEINGEKYLLDTYETEPISLTYNVNDILDISARNSSYSKTITIPDTKNNRKIFGNISDLAVDSTFNPNKKTKSYLLVDTLVIFEGYLQLRNAKLDLKTDTGEYEIVIFADNDNFFSQLDSKYLTDLDFSDLNHTWDAQTITTSWTQSWSKGYYYPLVDYGYGWDMLDIDQNSPGVTVSQMFPATNVKVIWNKIFQSASFSYQSSFLDSAQFQNLYIPFNGDSMKRPAQTVLDNYIKVGFTATQSLTASATSIPLIGVGLTTTVKLNDESSPNFTDTSNSWSTTLFEYTQQNSETIAQSFILEGTINIPSIVGIDVPQASADLGVSQTYPMIQIFRSRNIDGTTASGDGVSVANTTSNTNGSNILNGHSTFNLNIGNPYVDKVGNNYLFKLETVILNGNNQLLGNYPLFLGETIKIRLGVPVYTYNNTTNIPSGATIATISQNTIFYNSVIPDFIPGQSLDYNSVIPKNFKQIDFIMSIIKMFNLVVEPNKSYNNILNIEPRDDYYSAGVIKDWTRKLDRNTQPVETILGETQNILTTLKYKEDKDYYNVLYKQISNGIDYGTKQYFIENDFVTGEKKIEIEFSPTPIVKLANSTQFVIPVIGNIQNNTFTKTSHNPRILQKYTSGLLGVVSDTDKWKFNGVVYPGYPYLGHYDNPQYPQYDINFDQVLCNWQNEQDVTNDTLYTLYYQKMLSEISDKDSIILTANFYLTPQDISNFKFNDKIFLDNQYYKVNKITNYDPTKIDVCTVELIKTLFITVPRFRRKIINLKPVKPSRIVTPGSLNGIGLPNDVNSNDVYVSGQGNSINGSNSDIKGNNNIISSRNTSASGDDNQVKDSSYNLKITGDGNTTENGSSASQILGNNNTLGQNNKSVTINGDGNTTGNNVKNSLIVASGSSIETNINNTFVFRDNLTATQSDTLYLTNIDMTGSINGVSVSNIIQGDFCATGITVSDIKACSGEGYIKFLNGGFGDNLTMGITTSTNLEFNVIVDPYNNGIIKLDTLDLTTGDNGYLNISPLTSRIVIDSPTYSTILQLGNDLINIFVENLDTGDSQNLLIRSTGFEFYSSGTSSILIGNPFNTNNLNTDILSRNSSTGLIEVINSSTLVPDFCSSGITVSNIRSCDGTVGITASSNKVKIYSNGLEYGLGNTASGLYSATLGINNLASGINSISINDTNRATGVSSFASGFNSNAFGDYSHTEGYVTYTGNVGAHAEGANTQATAFASHAEGYFNQATGAYSHAEGVFTLASNTSAHTEGVLTNASGQSSHAEGNSTSATATASHSEGVSTTSSNEASHAEGKSTTASGAYSHSEGYLTLASGLASHAEGLGTTASGLVSHAIGNDTLASNFAGFVGGVGSISSGFISFAFGEYCNASSKASISLGSNNDSSGEYTMSFGKSNTSSGDYSISGGNNNNATKYGSIVFGVNNDSSGTASSVFGVSNETISENSFIGGGVLNSMTSSGINNFIGGGQANKISTGTNNSIVGGNNNNIKLSTNNNFILGGNSNDNSGNGCGILASANSIITASCSNTVISGGNNISATQSNTVYTPNIKPMGNIQYSITTVGSTSTTLSGNEMSVYGTLAIVSGNITTTMPASPFDGQTISFRRTESTIVTWTIAANSGQTINKAGVVGSILVTEASSVILQYYNGVWYSLTN